jgi:hypothetical protein
MLLWLLFGEAIKLPCMVEGLWCVSKIFSLSVCVCARGAGGEQGIISGFKMNVIRNDDHSTVFGHWSRGTSIMFFLITRHYGSLNYYYFFFLFCFVCLLVCLLENWCSAVNG